MIALLTVIIFPIAMLIALATIGWMLFGYHEKMVAALVAHPSMIAQQEMTGRYVPIRAIRAASLPNSGRPRSTPRVQAA